MIITVIDGSRQRIPLLASLREYWEFGSLVKYLTLRDIRLRYRYASLGASWVVLQPLIPMIIFTGVFGRVLRPSTSGVPYSLFVLAGLVPWSFFSAAVSRACLAFVSSANLLAKVYFPRGILPASAILGGSLDLAVGCGVLMIYSVWEGYYPTWRWLLLPGVALQTILVAFFVALGLATLNALIRDVKQAMQFLMQVWLYASPVAYATSFVPERYRWAVGLNPMTSVLDGFRWCMFGISPSPGLYWGSIASTLAVAACAIWLYQYFQHSLVERV